MYCMNRNQGGSLGSQSLITERNREVTVLQSECNLILTEISFGADKDSHITTLLYQM